MSRIRRLLQRVGIAWGLATGQLVVVGYGLVADKKEHTARLALVNSDRTAWLAYWNSSQGGHRWYIWN